nr:transposase [Microvirga massiliensis]
MTVRETRPGEHAVTELLARDADYLRTMAEAIVQATLEAEMTETLGAKKSERAPAASAPARNRRVRLHKRRRCA